MRFSRRNFSVQPYRPYSIWHIDRSGTHPTFCFAISAAMCDSDPDFDYSLYQLTAYPRQARSSSYYHATIQMQAAGRRFNFISRCISTSRLKPRFEQQNIPKPADRGHRRTPDIQYSTKSFGTGYAGLGNSLDWIPHYMEYLDV